MHWNDFFLRMCRLVATKSKDPSTKTGCVVVDQSHRIRSMGYNGFPQGVRDDPKRYDDRELKYRMIAHCDLNAIFSAARQGISLADCTMYLTGPPCGECAKGIIQAGISEVIWPKVNPFEKDPLTAARWKDSLELALLMMGEAGVLYERWKETA